MRNFPKFTQYKLHFPFISLTRSEKFQNTLLRHFLRTEDKLGHGKSVGVSAAFPTNSHIFHKALFPFQLRFLQNSDKNRRGETPSKSEKVIIQPPQHINRVEIYASTFIKISPHSFLGRAGKGREFKENVRTRLICIVDVKCLQM